MYFWSYANEDWKNVFEKDVVTGQLRRRLAKDQNPDIDAVKALVRIGRRISSARMSLTSVSRRICCLYGTAW